MSQYLDNFSPFQAPLKSHHWQKFDTTGLNCTIRFKLLNKPLNRYQLPGGPGNIIRPYWKWRQIRCPGAKLSQGCRKVSLPAAHTSPELSPPSVVLRPSNWCSSPRGEKKESHLNSHSHLCGSEDTGCPAFQHNRRLELSPSRDSGCRSRWQHQIFQENTFESLSEQGGQAPRKEKKKWKTIFITSWTSAGERERRLEKREIISIIKMI